MEVQMQWKGGTSRQEDERRLIGRVISNSRISVGAVKEHVWAAWKPKQKLEVKVLGFNLFEFMFNDGAEARKALDESPWVVRQHMLALERRKPYMCDSEIQVKTCTFWVQFHDIPPEGWMGVNVRGMAEKIGRVIEVEDPEDERYASRSFCRAKVEIDVEKSLVAVFKVPRPDDLPEAKVKVKYEKLARFCYICGKLGHDERSCNVEEDEEFSGESRRMYDANMCAQPYRAPNATAARGSSNRPATQRQGNKEGRREIVSRGSLGSTEVIDKAESDVPREVALQGMGNENPIATFNFRGGAGRAEVLVGSSVRNLQFVNFFEENMGNLKEGPLLVWSIRPKSKFLDREVGSSSNQFGLGKGKATLIENETGKEEEIEAQANNQQVQMVIREEAYVGALVHQVERVNLKREADPDWTSPSGKRRKAHEQDSPESSV